MWTVFLFITVLSAWVNISGNIINVYVLFYPRIHRGGGRWYCRRKPRDCNCGERCTRARCRRRRFESRVRGICISIFFLAGLHFLRQLNSKSHYFRRERRKKRVRPSPEPSFRRAIRDYDIDRTRFRKWRSRSGFLKNGFQKIFSATANSLLFVHRWITTW